MTTLLMLLLASGFAPLAKVIVVPPAKPDSYSVYGGTNSGGYIWVQQFPGTNTSGVITNFIKGKTNYFAITTWQSGAQSEFSAECAVYASNTTQTITLAWTPRQLTNYVTVGVAIRCLTNLISTNRTLVYQTNWITLTNPSASPQYFDALMIVTNKP